MVNDYSKGKIYKIECNVTGEVYIGSTTEPSLARRLAGHKNVFCSWKEGKRKYKMSSFQILERGDYTIYLIENYPCESKDELFSREGYFIKEFISGGNCVNQHITGRTKQEYYIDNQEYIKDKSRKWGFENKDKRVQYRKKYQEGNQELIKERSKTYKEQNKEELKLKDKEYREKNKEEIRLRQKEFREKNKEKISLKGKEKTSCDCGAMFRVGGISRHLKTAKHIKFINLQHED